MRNPITDQLLERIRNGQTLTRRQQIELAVRLSLPAIVAQLSSVLMQYIDASMVGHLGATEAASIGLVATTTWLFGGLTAAVSTGFSVQVAHCIGAGQADEARSIVRQAYATMIAWTLCVMSIALAISPYLPVWLGAGAELHAPASLYFRIFAFTLPVMGLNWVSGGMLRCSGNIRVPSMLSVLMCVLDVVFNFLLIFPTRTVQVLGVSFTVWGAGWGVAGAAMGTFFAIFTVMSCMAWFLLWRSPQLNQRGLGKWHIRFSRDVLRKAVTISLPMAFERVVMCGAQVFSTAIVAPLGTIAIAANSFGITIESLCYMPGYGVAESATTLTGQTLGANRPELTRSFTHIVLALGMGVMTFMGVLMFVFAPEMMRIVTPHPDIISLGTEVLRVEAFAEPMFAASIVAYSIFVGAGRTLTSSTINFTCIWLVRLSLAWVLAPHFGLLGVWVAMAVELCVRGLVFLSQIYRWHWLYRKMS